MQLASFHPYIAPEVIGCPIPLINQALVLVASEFCRTTLAWTEMSDPIPLVDEQQDYVPVAPTDAQLTTVRDVWCGERKLQPVPLARAYGCGSAREPTHYNMVGRVVVTVYPMPSGTTGAALVMRACFVPTLTAATLPDFFGDAYLDGLTSGAKARLMLMPGKAWSNPDLGTYYRKVFEDAMVEASAQEAHDHVPGVLTVAPRRFGF